MGRRSVLIAVASLSTYPSTSMRSGIPTRTYAPKVKLDQRKRGVPDGMLVRRSRALLTIEAERKRSQQSRSVPPYHFVSGSDISKAYDLRLCLPADTSASPRFRVKIKETI